MSERDRAWTAGPWKAALDLECVFAANNIVIADTTAISLPLEERRANTAIMAAAPDLYEALEASLTRYVRMVESGDCGFWDVEKEPGVIAARAALARARGETL